MLRARPRRRRRRCLWSRTRADGCSGLPSGKPRSSKSRGLVRAPAHQPTSRFCVLGIGKGAVCRRQPEGKKTTFLKAKHLPPGRASKLARTYPIRLIDRKRGEDGIRTIARRALACRTECPPRAYIFRSHRADGGHTNANEQPGGRAPFLPRQCVTHERVYVVMHPLCLPTIDNPKRNAFNCTQLWSTPCIFLKAPPNKLPTLSSVTPQCGYVRFQLRILMMGLSPIFYPAEQEGWARDPWESLRARLARP